MRELIILVSISLDRYEVSVKLVSLSWSDFSSQTTVTMGGGIESSSSFDVAPSVRELLGSGGIGFGRAVFGEDGDGQLPGWCRGAQTSNAQVRSIRATSAPLHLSGPVAAADSIGRSDVNNVTSINSA